MSSTPAPPVEDQSLEYALETVMDEYEIEQREAVSLEDPAPTIANSPVTGTPEDVAQRREQMNQWIQNVMSTEDEKDDDPLTPAATPFLEKPMDVTEVPMNGCASSQSQDPAMNTMNENHVKPHTVDIAGSPAQVQDQLGGNRDAEKNDRAVEKDTVPASEQASITAGQPACEHTVAESPQDAKPSLSATDQIMNPSEKDTVPADQLRSNEPEQNHDAAAEPSLPTTIHLKDPDVDKPDAMSLSKVEPPHDPAHDLDLDLDAETLRLGDQSDTENLPDDSGLDGSSLSTDSDVADREATLMGASLGAADDDDDDVGVFKYPPPPTEHHPNIKRVLKSAAEAIIFFYLDLEFGVWRSLDFGSVIFHVL